MIFWSYLYTFALTNLLEIPVYYFFYRKNNLSFGAVVRLVVLANAVTHPLIFFGVMGQKYSYIASVLLAETIAVVGEAIIDYTCAPRKISWERAGWAAFAANVFSWQVAPLVSYVLFFFKR